MNIADKYILDRNFFLRSWHPYLWLTLTAFLLNIQLFTFSEYTHFDDYFLIIDNFSYIDQLSDIGHAFFEDVSHQGQGGNLYRPILTISFILSAQISGTAPFGYHLIDILLHCAGCCLLFAALQILGFKRLTSFLGTLFFCIHPAITQATAWIAGRNDSLLAVFILSAFITYTKFLSSSSLKWYIFHLIFFAFAMFTKESAILFPFLVLLYSFSLKKEKMFSLTTVLLFVGWGIVFINWHILRSAAMIAPVGDKFQAAATILSNLWVLLFYFGKIFWPIDLAFGPVVSDMHITIGIISVVLLSIALLLSERRNWKFILFGAAWYIAFLIPTLFYDSAVRIPPKFYEHRIYIPFMGILFVLLSLSYTKRTEIIKKFPPFVLILLFGFLGCFSFIHTQNFKNSLTLSEYDASTSPNDPRLHNAITRMNIPKILNQEICTFKGISQISKDNRITVSNEETWKITDNLKNKLKSNHTDPELHHALAIVYFARGLFLSSEKNFLAAIQDMPQDANVPYNLGIMYYSAHDRKKTEKAWLEALRLDSTMGQAHHNISFLYYESGQNELAWFHCQKAIQCGIQIPTIYINDIRRKLSMNVSNK
jgi:protein O-mannosyl-transferase